MVSTTKCASFNRGTVLEEPTDSLIAELQSTPMDTVLFWNMVTLQACANDYDRSIAPVPDQIGPTATSRALAIIHGAMYESLTAFNRAFKPMWKSKNFPVLGDVSRESIVDVAIMESAYQTLSYFYPKQRPIFDAVRKVHLQQIASGYIRQADINKGIFAGKWIASFILNDRATDGSQQEKIYTPRMAPGYHQVDPTHPNQGFLGANWGSVKPFTLDFSSQYRPANITGDTPEARRNYLNSADYAIEFNEVRSFGSKTSTVRTEDQTQIAIAWAYDGAPKVGVPPRLYNQIVRLIAIQQNNTMEKNARLFALINYAMADAGIATWEAKYYYNYWRPIVAIRQAAEPSWAEPDWTPLGSPADGAGIDFTPPFPAFVSGHSTFGSACFEMLRLFYNRDNIDFQFQSDEYNGKTIDSNTKLPRPALTRTYSSFTEAETENYLSRIYLGVHWRSDAEHGKILGRKVAKHVFNKMM
ncbi:unnamed protein product [Rotaria sordida]|uniref:Phosphatidic acid phosphatase type 2/haloperoxidase domain-containing protein n=1 Tax=Rotaria sordida TaxID=392033 RepID=A0A815U4M7_9BILA|nr:unnamed protein product [Rotaria sordida]